MINLTRKEMSAILKEMALTTLVNLVYKRRHYPSDKRRITACILHPNKVRVEWTE